MKITEETEVDIVGSVDLDELELEFLKSVADTEIENGEVTRCVIRLDDFLSAGMLYNCMEDLRHDWR